MNWVEKYNIKSVMYVWQGGQEGGNSVADLLCGDVAPNGKLTDTIADSIDAYPSDKTTKLANGLIIVNKISINFRKTYLSFARVTDENTLIGSEIEELKAMIGTNIFILASS